MQTSCPKCSTDLSVSRTNHVVQSRGSLAVLEDVEVESCPTCRDVKVSIPEKDLLFLQMEPFKASKVWPPRFRFAEGQWIPLSAPSGGTAQLSDAVADFIDRSAA